MLKAKTDQVKGESFLAQACRTSGRLLQWKTNRFHLATMCGYGSQSFGRGSLSTNLTTCECSARRMRRLSCPKWHEQAAHCVRLGEGCNFDACVQSLWQRAAMNCSWFPRTGGSMSYTPAHVQPRAGSRQHGLREKSLLAHLRCSAVGWPPSASHLAMPWPPRRDGLFTRPPPRLQGGFGTWSSQPFRTSSAVMWNHGQTSGNPIAVCAPAA